MCECNVCEFSARCLPLSGSMAAYTEMCQDLQHCMVAALCQNRPARQPRMLHQQQVQWTPLALHLQVHTSASCACPVQHQQAAPTLLARCTSCAARTRVHTHRVNPLQSFTRPVSTCARFCGCVGLRQTTGQEHTTQQPAQRPMCRRQADHRAGTHHSNLHIYNRPKERQHGEGHPTPI